MGEAKKDPYKELEKLTEPIKSLEVTKKEVNGSSLPVPL